MGLKKVLKGENTDNLKIKGMFSFNPAGQGGFYAGGIYIEDKMELSIVYDCGTFSKRDSIDKSIDEFHNTLEKYKNVLNILVISHLDSDHVNRLVHLFANINKIDFIIMPYISRISAIKYGIKSLNYTIAKESDFYINFITNPISAIKEYVEVGKFIFINAERADDDKYESIKEQYGDKNNLIFTGVVHRRISKKVENIYGKNNGDGVYIFKEKIDITMLSKERYIWTFKLWENEIQYEKYKSSFFKELKDKNIDISSIENIKNALKDKQKELKKSYANNSKCINDTSVVLYHAPLIDNEYSVSTYIDSYLNNQVDSHFYKNCQSVTFNNDANIGRVGTLLTGDIDLKKFYDDVMINFKNELENIFIVTIPHHGSKNSSNKRFYNNGYPWLYIIQAGLPSRFSHPSSDIIRYLREYNKKFCIANEYKKITYIIETVITYSDMLIFN